MVAHGEQLKGTLGQTVKITAEDVFIHVFQE